MANSPIAAGAEGRSRIFGNTRLILCMGLVCVLALFLALSWATRGAMSNLAALRARNGAAGQSLVDLRPWQTAQTLASLAVTAEEQEYAREAERLADHEVDQAFAAALRAAQLQARQRVLTGEALALSQKVAQLQQEITQDQAAVARLKAQATPHAETASSAASTAAGSDAQQVAEAQLGLDADELTDAQRDLDRATGDLSVRLQDELASHEASMKKYDSQQQSQGQIAIVSVKGHGTLASRIEAWFNQRSRSASIDEALAEAQSDAQSLTGEHNALEAKANARAAGGGAVTLAGIQDRSTERQILSIDDDRIQTDQQLAAVYGKWGGQVQMQHRILQHLILGSLELIVLIVLGMVVGDAAVRQLMAHPSLDRRQMEILRTILEVSVQALGIALIVLVIFGPPKQTATMIGLTTAALTISLQDYILAFVGWFMLVGRNGIHVGDLVEINGVCGEVAEVGLMSSTLLETTGLAGEPTGRTIAFLNSFAIRGTYFNFSSKGQWLWDQITVTVPAGDDVYGIARRIEEAAHAETTQWAQQAEQEWKHSARGGMKRLSGAPSVTLHPSAAGAIEVELRYVTPARGRAKVRDRLYRAVIRLLHEKSGAAEAEAVAAGEA
jgi:small-conductance mechanosensitive channel